MRKMQDSTSAKYLSAGTVARKLGVTKSAVQRWCRAGRLTAHRTLGGHWRITREAVAAYLSKS